MTLRPSALLVLLALTACSDASRERAAAYRSLPEAGPVAAARDDESVAVAGRAKDVVEVLPQPLELDACIIWALAHNRDLRQQISQAERARLGITAARSDAYAPQLTATASRTLEGTDSDGRTRTDAATATVALNTSFLGFTLAPYASEGWGQIDGVAGDDPYTRTVGIALSRRLLALHEWSRQSAPLTAADRSFAQGVNNLALRVRRLEADAAGAFLEVQKAEARMVLRERRVEQAQASLKAVREGVASGLKAPVEEANATIELNQAQADLLADRTAVANARDRLLSLLDRPLGGELAIVPRAIDDRRPDLPPTADDIAAVLARHEDLANLRSQVDAAEDEVGFSRDEVRPDLTATVAAERRWAGGSLNDTTTRDDVVSLTLALAMPLDAWAGARARLEIQERLAREQRLRLKERMIGLDREVRELRRRIDQLVTGVDLALGRLEAERAKYAATEASYRAGRLDNLELTRARQTLDQAEVNLLESRSELVLALYDRRVLVPSGGAAR